MALENNGGPIAPRFTVGIVLSTSLRVISANVLRFLGVILALGVPAVVLIALLLLSVAQGVTNTSGSMVSFQLKGGAGVHILFGLAMAAIALGFYVLTQAALIYGTLQTLRGRKVTIRSCIANAFAALPRVVLAGLILAVVLAIVGLVAVQIFRTVAMGGGPVIGTVAGFAFTAVILTILVLTWVFIPAIMVERVGPVDSFSRSMELTKGRRWGIFAIFVIVIVANWVVSYVSFQLPKIGAPAAGAVLNIASNLFFTAFGAVLAAVGYYVLRAEKEGVAIDDVVKVFE